MREMRIPKGGGRYRVVVVPTRKQKARLRAELPRLEAAAMLLDVHGVQHGFTPGRSPVTNAAAHKGYRFTASWDLVDCFDRVKREHVEAMGVTAPKLAYYGGIARQGLPTSPALCNIALAALDRDIVTVLGGRGAYTRYADDLTVSTDDHEVVREMLAAMPGLVERHGHEVHPRKTHVQDARSGRRVITGVAVEGDRLYATRESRRKLRAAQHRGKSAAVAGLEEWARLKPPNLGRWLTPRLGSPDEAIQSMVTVVARRGLE